MDTQGNDFAVTEGAGNALGAFVGLQSELAMGKLYNGAVGLCFLHRRFHRTRF
jgi:hypothetical protein